MSIRKPSAGTRGAKPPPRLLARFLMPVLERVHRRQGDRFSGFDVLYLHTVGARTGERRTSTLARMDDGKGGVLVVASYGGAQHHPAWYHNVVAHPDQVSVEYGGRTQRATVRQLEGDERAAAWAFITAQVPRFRGYESQTDRELPVLRLTPTA